MITAIVVILFFLVLNIGVLVYKIHSLQEEIKELKITTNSRLIRLEHPELFSTSKHKNGHYEIIED